MRRLLAVSVIALLVGAGAVLEAERRLAHTLAKAING